MLFRGTLGKTPLVDTFGFCEGPADLVVSMVREPVEVSGLAGCGMGIGDSFGSIEITFPRKGEP